MRDFSHLFPDRIVRCHYCADQLFKWNDPETKKHPDLRASRDHTVPQSNGGKKWVVCCVGCNALKAHDPYEMFLSFMTHAGGREMPRNDRKKAYYDFRARIILIGVLAFQEELERLEESTCPTTTSPRRGPPP